MRVHDTIEPLRGLRTARRDLIEKGRIVGDGGYSRVIAVNAYSVLKLTSCQQTKLLLAQLHKLDKARYPSALPVVLECWGNVAVDADGHMFAGYVLERLYPVGDVTERFRGKRLGGALIHSRRELSPSPFQIRDAELRELENILQDARERCITNGRPTHLEHLEMAEQLALMQLPRGFQKTFDYLANFLRTSQGDLDLFQKGNILLDCTGQPMLADPVAEQTAEPWPEDAFVEQTQPCHALVARSVVALQGLQAVVEWDTVSLSPDADALESALQDLLTVPSTTYEACVTLRGGAKHRELISAGRHLVDSWKLPVGTRREALRNL